MNKRNCYIRCDAFFNLTTRSDFMSTHIARFLKENQTAVASNTKHSSYNTTDGGKK